jgi:hypothetical protein
MTPATWQAAIDESITATDAAYLADLSSNRVRRFCIEGRFPAVYLHGMGWLIHQQSFSGWLKQPRPGGRPSS